MFVKQAGDTIIEVLFAITVFSLLAVGALSIMNQGTATAQKALEITLVRQQMDAQAATLRYVHDAYSDSLLTNDDGGAAGNDWKKISSKDNLAVAKATTYGTTTDGTCPDKPDNAFVFNAHSGRLANQANIKTANDSDSTPFSQVVYNTTAPDVFDVAYGLWIEAIRQNDSQNYVDFHIRSCWYAPGSGPATTLGTIVRLYAPTE